MPPVELILALLMLKRPWRTTIHHFRYYYLLCCMIATTTTRICLSRQSSSTTAAFTISFSKTVSFVRHQTSYPAASGRSFSQRNLVLRRAGSTTTSEMTTESSNSNNNEKPRMMLIDVDCNLWHKDLPSLLLPTDDKDEILNDLPLQFRILRQDAVQNVQAVLSPSSTLQEAASGLAALRVYNDYLLKCNSSSSSNEDELNINLLPKVKTTVGVHPYHVLDQELQGKDVEEHLETIEELLSTNNDVCAAVGECGLDASDGFPELFEQIPWFAAQIALAEMLQLPLFVHERLAFEETMDLLEDVTTAVIIHCFTGNVDECRAYVERGYSISLSGYIFRDDADAVRQCLEENVIPLDKLMLETDAPYMGFEGCREAFCDKNADLMQSKLNSKKRKKLTSSQYPNAPSSLEKVLLKVLHHVNVGRSKRGEELLNEIELADHTSNNANHFFQFGLDYPDSFSSSTPNY